jgi:hypothetical protein
MWEKRVEAEAAHGTLCLQALLNYTHAVDDHVRADLAQSSVHGTDIPEVEALENIVSLE